MTGMTVEIISFGYGHGPAPTAHLTYDVRRHFRDPHINPRLRGLTAADRPVVDTVLGTPGVPQVIASIVEGVRGFLDGPSPGLVRVAIGCVGGRHRSAVIASQVADRLSPHARVRLTHRDIHRPVINRGLKGMS
jgi:UPF0042 nucleotide-binding protein